MRWLMVVLAACCGCGKSDPPGPSAADLQVELATLERMEREMADLKSNYLPSIRRKADRKEISAKEVNEAITKYDSELVPRLEKRLAAQKALVEKMEAERRASR